MRDIISCFSENAVNVTPHSSCSSFSSKAFISPNLTPSTQNSVSYVYKAILPNNQKHFFITVTWSMSHSNQGLTISLGEEETIFRLNTNSRFFRKKGSKLLESDELKIEIFWDFYNAKYDTGPEPVNDFFVAILIDAEVVLILGEVTMTKKFKTRRIPLAKVSLLSRREHCSGNTIYKTKTQFCENGTLHDILIKCSGENEGLHYPVLSVCIDNKTVIRVKRLQWNFRGNHPIFVDGLVVDLLWDVHNWFFNPAPSGYAVFMFRTKTELDSRLWLEEKTVLRDEDTFEFSLLIYACKST
ncbi:hypothetical protein Lalb_Chr24g0395171 [Lupinus albus]|uniref:DUF868 family protein n=1 Tax=Lupinus albus TaxID=3870 RepID=A0A6A4N7K4_LUPAL|nr:hypothetical protein Lalb_Chr24g0395171 [Lupinus albus]